MTFLGKITILSVAVFLACGTARADSVDNINRSITILASIGTFQSTIKSTDGMTQSQFEWMTEQYNLAYQIGKNYKSREVKKKLGRQFYKQWKKNVSAMKTISNLYTRLQEKGGRLTESEVKDLSVALYVMENFRLFYVDWRK